MQSLDPKPVVKTNFYLVMTNNFCHTKIVSCYRTVVALSHSVEFTGHVIMPSFQDLSYKIRKQDSGVCKTGTIW